MGWQVEPPTTQLAILPGLVAPTAVVQATTPVQGVSPVTASFPNPVGVNNSVIVTFTSSGSTTGAVAPASGPDTFTNDANVVLGASGNGQLFHKSNSAGGYSSVTVTLAGNTLRVYAYEVTGAVIFDNKTSGQFGSNSFSVGFTPANQAEFLPALSLHDANTGLSTSPAAPWVNESVLSSGSTAAVGSYQFVTTTSTVTYSGTWAAGGTACGAVVGGYRLTNPGGTVPSNECILYYFGGSLWALGPSGNPVLLATT